MQVPRDSFFRIFQSDLRIALQRFFENRQARVTPEIAGGFVDAATLERLMGLGLVEYDGEVGEYRLDERLERFLDEMLGAAEVAQADWLVGLLEEVHRTIEGHQKLSSSGKGDALLRRICRLLRTCRSRIQRHLEEVKAAVDYDYRAGSDYEVKLMKLEWHLARARSYGDAVADLDNLLRNDVFFQVHQELELMSLRRQLVHKCGQVGDALIDVYQRIEDYLNRVQRDFARARKLIQLCGLIERHEHLTGSNLSEVATTASGPWFYEMRLRTLLHPSIVDGRPELLQRALARAGIGEVTGKARRVQVNQQPLDDMPPFIDWHDVYEAFAKQPADLFVFLGTVRVEGRQLTEEERIDGYCAIITNEDWAGAWDGRTFDLASEGDWEYAVVKPPAFVNS